MILFLCNYFNQYNLTTIIILENILIHKSKKICIKKTNDKEIYLYYLNIN